MLYEVITETWGSRNAVGERLRTGSREERRKSASAAAAARGTAAHRTEYRITSYNVCYTKLLRFLLSSREPVRNLSPTALRPPQVSGTGEQLSPEDREIVANLEILEDPDLFNEPDIEEMEIFVPSSQQRG